MNVVSYAIRYSNCIIPLLPFSQGFSSSALERLQVVSVRHLQLVDVVCRVGLLSL
jgi:hypothetical protein